MPCVNGPLCIATCENFAREVAAVVAAEGWTDVVPLRFPARCGRPALAWDELRALLPEGTSRLLVFGRACLCGIGDAPAGFPATQLIPSDQCFHMIAGRTLVNEAIEHGAYLITPAWVARWREQLAALGFATDGARELFGEVAREMVLLDTGVDPQAPARLAELGAAVGLPTRRIAIGLDHLRLSLARHVHEWRIEQTRAATEADTRRHAAELADHVAAMDMLSRLARARHEEEAVAAIEELFRTLFLPAALHYLTVEGRVPHSERPVPSPLLEQMRELDSDHSCTADGGFIVRIQHAGETLGVAAVQQLAFPAYRDRYLNLALALTGVCGLAIANARNRRRLVEAEKMSSLSYVVAGVAHEVNTPLGVVIAAASALRRDSRQLATRFAGRDMTQADLERYLSSTEDATNLVLRNLERIGRLVDAFRCVSVDGVVLQQRTVSLRQVLEETVQAFGEELRLRQVEVQIDCDPALSIESYRSDWIEIARNLIANSLRHGFRKRPRGRIDIRARTTGTHLHFEYRDDGVGVEPDVAARIFDPFFTTDHQAGMGLGMHLVYNLVNRHLDGIIRCDAAPGAGARFSIVVPLTRAQEAA